MVIPAAGRSLFSSLRLRAERGSAALVASARVASSTRPPSAAPRVLAEPRSFALPDATCSVLAFERALPGTGRLDSETTGAVRVTSEGGSARATTVRFITDAGGLATADGTRPRTLVLSGETLTA
jgi:hypothetical protein